MRAGVTCFGVGVGGDGGGVGGGSVDNHSGCCIKRTPLLIQQLLCVIPYIFLFLIFSNKYTNVLQNTSNIKLCTCVCIDICIAKEQIVFRAQAG